MTPSATAREATRRRLMLALDAALADAADVEAAVDLAALLNADLHALFVEDTDLAACCGLPFARELARVGSRSRSLERETVDRALRRGVERTRRRLDEAARRRMLPFSAGSARGKLARVALEQSASAQLVVLLRERAAPRTGAPASAVRRPVLLWWERERAAGTALETAARLALHAGAGLVVAHAAAGAAEDERLRTLARAALGGTNAPLWLAAVDDHAPQLLLGLAARLGTGVLVMAADGRLATEAVLATLAGSGRGPLVLAR